MINSKFHETFDPIELWVAKHSPLELLESKLDLEKMSRDIRIHYFVQFENFEQLKQFVEKNTNNSAVKKYKFSSETQFHHFPIIFVESTYQDCHHLSDLPEIVRIYGNQPIYLCGESFNDESNIPEIHASYEEITGKNIRIALVDSGIDSNKLTISEKQIQQIGDYFEESNQFNPHGTNLASIIVGSKNISQNYFTGIAPNVELFDVKVFDTDGSSTIYDLIIGLEKILDLPNEEMPHILLFGFSTGYKGISDDLLSHYLSQLSSKGIILIAPTGNMGPDPGNIGNPSMNPNVICIGAVDQNNNKLFFSGRNSRTSLDKSEQLKPTFVLPGKNIPTATTALSGTSGAASVFAGLSALIMQVVPNCTSSDLITSFKQNSINLHLSENTQGFGLPQIKSILQNRGKLKPKPQSYYKSVKFALKISGVITLIGVTLIYLARFII